MSVLAANTKENVIEVDTVGAESSDYYSSSASSETQSVASSVFNFTYENGRRYTQWGGEGKYHQPNDETEQDRLDITHHLQNILLGGDLHTAPIQNPQRVLDAGTGTGIWALDMGNRYPSTEVIGVDLSPIQPSWVASNVKFEVDDLEKDWTFKPEFFDFIHSRNLVMGIHNWKRYLEQMYIHLAPGGWFELSEQEQLMRSDDGTIDNSSLQKWFDIYRSLAPKIGLQFITTDELIQIAKDVGFVDVSVRKFKVPQGSWPKDKRLKELGKICVAILETGFDSHGLALFTKAGGMTTEEAKELSNKAFKDVTGRKVHAYCVVSHIIGRKPEKK